MVHKGAIQALAISGSAGDDLSPFLLALIKGLEYGCLGLALGWVSQRPWGGGGPHGSRVHRGSVFGGIVIALLAASAPEVSATILLSRGVTEVLFPVGCSLVLFSAEALGTSMSSD